MTHDCGNFSVVILTATADRPQSRRIRFSPQRHGGHGGKRRRRRRDTISLTIPGTVSSAFYWRGANDPIGYFIMLALLGAGAAYGLANKGKPGPALSRRKGIFAVALFGVAITCGVLASMVASLAPPR